MNHPAIVLSIAGSDPSGGAGIQADLKTFSALGAYGCAVLTALTAQSTRGVTGVHAVPAAFVTEQVLTLIDDVRLDAVKIGMLNDAATVDAVSTLVREHLDCPVVLDPVMVSTAGSRLLDTDAVQALSELVPHVDALTPNMPEAAILLGVDPARTTAELRNQAIALLAAGARRVLLKGGHHSADTVTDVWAERADQSPPVPSGPAGFPAAHAAKTVQPHLDTAAEPAPAVHLLQNPRVLTRNTHGTGCSLSSAVAALVPQHDDWLSAVRAAREWLIEALRRADDLRVGSGPGPVHHFHALWTEGIGGTRSGPGPRRS